MNIIEKQQIKHYHSSRLKQWEDNRALAQGWTSDRVQQARFDVITELVDFNDASVLDLGCGDGDLKRVLDKRFHRFDYIGVDQQPEFIEFAQQRFSGQRNTWFHLVDFCNCQLPVVDIVVVSGALSYHTDDPDYYMEMIAKFYAAAKRTLIFNMLDHELFVSTPLIVSHDRENIYKKCRELSSHVTLKTGYLDGDFTIMLNKSSK